ncbi:MAG TPA: hypothetical protein DEB40_10090 [Elusimicrobia bacterium]|nr:hypothetical protein [Elusimicrobiota bacterium]HBT62079.1 hypothetical protein [Elusimicrobiota bacterium]
MTPARIGAVMAWIRTTDLVEVRYHDGVSGFELATAEAAPAPPQTAFASRYVPVCASSVGLFQPHAPGHPRLGVEGRAVQAGDILGMVETGIGEAHKVLAPCPGRIARVLIEDGKAVQYGQPLFFLESGG